jgi:hypothetical protein
MKISKNEIRIPANIDVHDIIYQDLNRSIQIQPKNGRHQ